MKLKISRRFVLSLLGIALIFYFITSNFIYSLEYDNKEYREKIAQTEEEINNLKIKKNTSSSKDEAKKETDLKFENNIYYVKEEEKDE